MMILVTAFAVLFGVLKTLGAPPEAFVVITIFVFGIAASQSLLFKGKKPRLASFVGGMVMFGLFDVVSVPGLFFFHSRFFGPAMIASILVKMAIQVVVIGGPLGYIVGCFVASIFLVRKEPDDAEATIQAMPVEAPFPPALRRVPVGMPRRFSIGTMMILTALFAVLFGVLKACGAPPTVFAAISIFIGSVAACQRCCSRGSSRDWRHLSVES